MFRFLMSALSVLLVLGMVHPPLTLAKSPTDLTWPQFRGVRGENRSEGKIPTEFRPGRNELWHVEVPRGNSSPVIWDDHVFSTGADDTNLFVLCITRETGKLKWKREFKIEFDRDYFHTDSSPASPTCLYGRGTSLLVLWKLRHRRP